VLPGSVIAPPPAGPSAAADAAPPPLPPSPAGHPAPAAPPTVNPVKDLPVEPNAGPTNDNPTGRQEPGVSLEWIGPTSAKLGQAVICQIIVKNISTSRVRQVVVRARVPEGMTVNATEPKATAEDNHLVWNLGTLEVRQEKRLDLQVVPGTKGSISFPAFV